MTFNRHRRLGAGLAALGFMAGLAAATLIRRAGAEGIPTPPALFYSGTLLEKGAPVDGARSITIAVFNDQSAGAMVCQHTDTVGVVAGRFRLPLPDACVTGIHATANLFIEATVAGVKLGGRKKIGAVPYALEAARASEAAGPLKQQVAALQGRQPKLTCRYPKGPNSKGNLYANGSVAACAADEVLMGGACEVHVGSGATASHMNYPEAGNYDCILTNPGNPNESVNAIAACCKITQ